MKNPYTYGIHFSIPHLKKFETESIKLSMGSPGLHNATILVHIEIYQNEGEPIIYIRFAGDGIDRSYSLIYRNGMFVDEKHQRNHVSIKKTRLAEDLNLFFDQNDYLLHFIVTNVKNIIALWGE